MAKVDKSQPSRDAILFFGMAKAERHFSAKEPIS
jgi:hypothetical protein